MIKKLILLFFSAKLTKSSPPPRIDNNIRRSHEQRGEELSEIETPARLFASTVQKSVQPSDARTTAAGPSAPASEEHFNAALPRVPSVPHLLIPKTEPVELVSTYAGLSNVVAYEGQAPVPTKNKEGQAAPRKSSRKRVRSAGSSAQAGHISETEDSHSHKRDHGGVNPRIRFK